MAESFGFQATHDRDLDLEHCALDSGIGSSVASSDASASDEHLQANTNPTRIIHLHNNLGHRRLSSPSYSPPVQHFSRQKGPHLLEYDSLPVVNKSIKKSVNESEHNSENQETVGAKKCQSWLLRLFESKMFDASMAVHYLFNSKEPGVLSYLGKKFTVKNTAVCVHFIFSSLIQFLLSFFNLSLLCVFLSKNGIHIRLLFYSTFRILRNIRNFYTNKP